MEVETPQAGTEPTAPPAGALETIISGTPPDEVKAPETQASTETPADPAATSKEEPKAPEVPEKYEFKVPEGMTVDPDMLSAYEPIFKELELDQAKAQKLVDIYAQLKASEVEKQQAAFIQQHADWTKAVTSDPDLGGKNFDTTKKHAMSAVARFGSPELKAYLETTGLGSHPELVRAFAKVGAAMSEDTFVNGKASIPIDPAKVMFPNTK